MCYSFAAEKQMNNLPDEILVELFRFLPVSDLLSMRKVSHRHRRVARDSQLWKWTRIVRMKLYRDKKYFTRKGRSAGTMMADLRDVGAEEYGWIVCRVVAAVVPRYMSTKYVINMNS